MATEGIEGVYVETRNMERPEQIVARLTPLSQPPEDDESHHPRTPARRR